MTMTAVASEAVRRTGRSAHARVHMWTLCVGMLTRSLGDRQRMRTPEKGSSHLVGAGFDVGTMILGRKERGVNQRSGGA
jgi:hypothetical protein